MALFAVQVLGGLLAGWIYVAPNTLSDVLPFNIVRMLHTNSLVVCCCCWASWARPIS